jgi:hypothetical protein
LSHKFTKRVEVIDKILFHVPAVVEVVIAVEASVDIELEVSFIPAIWDINVTDNLLLFKIVFIYIFNKFLILDLNLIHS